VAAGALIVELGLRAFAAYVESRTAQPTTMFARDPYLGWRLRPGWRGHHGHYDFELDYSTNRHGFRGEFGARQGSDGKPRFAVLGDSVTFGMGSADADTFVARLNVLAGGETEFLNFGIPGYSTDQEVLLLEREVFSFRPSHVLLVVFLANDLIDNEGPFPLHAILGKPYFELREGRLVLRNSPVSDRLKPASERALDLRERILGPDAGPAPRLSGLLLRSALLARLGYEPREPEDLARRFDERLAPCLELFEALVARARRLAERHQTALSLVLLGGISYVEQPESFSARFQDHLRRRILERRAALGIEVIDLAEAMAARHAREGTRFFNPNEQHFSALGHEFVAGSLWNRLREPPGGR
jgi:hypothetical protein